MASVAGGHFQQIAGNHNVTATAHPSAGHLSLASITELHSAGTGTQAASHVNISAAGEVHAAATQGVVAQTHQAGNTTLHLQDGSTITLVGMAHVHATFIH